MHFLRFYKVKIGQLGLNFNGLVEGVKCMKLHQIFGGIKQLGPTTYEYEQIFDTSHVYTPLPLWSKDRGSLETYNLARKFLLNIQPDNYISR